VNDAVCTIIEGLDWAGKSTLAGALADAVHERSGRIRIRPLPLVLREPSNAGGRGLMGLHVREALARKTCAGSVESTWPPEAWIAYFGAAMLMQNQDAVEALAAGRDVIYDRRELSMMAYQCWSTGRFDLLGGEHHRSGHQEYARELQRGCGPDRHPDLRWHRDR